MEQDDWKNLGMGNLHTSQNVSTTDTKDTEQADSKKVE